MGHHPQAPGCHMARRRRRVEVGGSCGQNRFWLCLDEGPDTTACLGPASRAVRFANWLPGTIRGGTHPGYLSPLIAGRLWVGFGDNDGIQYALARGGGHNPESNMIIGKIWLHLANINTDSHATRVESAANIADGPSRDSFELLNSMHARFVEPQLPDWLHDLWQLQ